MSDNKIVFNDFKEYKDLKIPKGQTVIFEILNKRPDPDNKGLFLCPIFNIRAKDTIMVDGDVKEIACIISTNSAGDITLDQEMFFLPQSLGRIVLHSGDPISERRYKYLWFSDMNGSKTNRSTRENPIYKFLDEGQDAKDKADKNVRLLKTQSAIYDLSTVELTKVSKEVGISGSNSDDTRNKLVEFSKMNVSAVSDSIKKYSGKSVKELDNDRVGASIKNAFDIGILVHNKNEKTISYIDGENSEEVYAYSIRYVYKSFEKHLKENHGDVLKKL